jgi:Tfp pilus assembly protein PilF
MMMNNRQTQIFCSVGAIALLGGCSAFQPQAKLEIRSVESVQHSASKSDALAEGRALLKLGQNANAISAFRAALRDQPENGDAYNGLAIAYDRIGRKDLAQRYFELALSFDPENPRFRANLARLFNRSGQPQLAADLVEQPASAERQWPMWRGHCRHRILHCSAIWNSLPPCRQKSRYKLQP